MFLLTGIIVVNRQACFGKMIIKTTPVSSEPATEEDR